MAFRKDPVSLEYSDDDILDRMTADYEPPSYPYGCQFRICEDDLEQVAGEPGDIGDTMKFAAMAEVTAVHQSADGSRVELKITDFAGEDGDFVQIKDEPEGVDDSAPWLSCGCVCLSQTELEKMGLEADCERGDLIHLVGELRLESISRTEQGGDVATLQITHLSYVEDESSESRER